MYFLSAWGLPASISVTNPPRGHHKPDGPMVGIGFAHTVPTMGFTVSGVRAVVAKTSAPTFPRPQVIEPRQDHDASVEIAKPLVAIPWWNYLLPVRF